MQLSPKKSAAIIFILVIILITLMWRGVNAREYEHNSNINEQLIHVEPFLVRAIEGKLTSSVNGTVFVKQSTDGELSMQIIAAINIDVQDFGGAAFLIENGWIIKNITSTYTNSSNEEPITIWTSEDSNYSAMIEVARNRLSTEGKASEGQIVIDLIRAKKAKKAEETTVKVEVGATVDNGVINFGTDVSSVLLPLTKP